MQAIQRVKNFFLSLHSVGKPLQNWTNVKHFETKPCNVTNIGFVINLTHHSKLKKGKTDFFIHTNELLITIFRVLILSAFEKVARVCVLSFNALLARI